MGVLSKGGSFILLEVGSIYPRKSQPNGLDFFIFDGNGRKMVATRLHTFFVVRDCKRQVVTTDQIRPSDKIWVDRHEFEADGSLTKLESPHQAAW